MISTAYLHEHDIFDSFMEETYHIMNDVYDARNKLIAAENYIDEQVFMGESADDYQVMLEETKKNVFARIGDAVKEFIKKFCDMLTKFASDIKGHVTGMKKHLSDEALKEQMRSNPELAEKFINAVMSGNIKIHDVKDMDDLLKTAQELTKQLSTGKINEEEYMDKVDKKLEKYAGRAKSITAILGVVVGTTGILAAIEKLRGGGYDAQLKMAEARDKVNEMREDAMRAANSEAGGNSNRLSVWLKGQQKFAAALGHDCTGWRAFLAKGEGWLGDFVGKINTGYVRKDNNGAKDRNAARARANDEQTRKTARIQAEERDIMDKLKEERQAKRREKERQEERNYANRQVQHDVRRAEQIAAAQERGKRSARTKDDDITTAFNQQWGKNEANRQHREQFPISKN